MFTSPRNMACKNRTAELKSRQRCNLTSSIWALFIYPTNTWSSVLYTRGFTENRWMFLILVVGSCCGAYRTWKPYDDASFDGTESFRTAKIQVNKFSNFITRVSFKTLFGFTRSFFVCFRQAKLCSRKLFSDRSDRNFLSTIWT